MSRLESRIVGGMNPIQKYMLRLVLFGAGKTIKHNGRICEVVEAHDRLRQLCPLVNEDLSEPKPLSFWVPRRAPDRKEMHAERTRRQYVTGLRVPFPAPHYTGDTCEGLLAVPYGFSSEFPTTPYLLDLVHNYDYSVDAALAAMSRAHIWRNPRPDRRRNGGHPTADCQESGARSSARFAQPAHPYNPAAPNRRTTQSGGFSRDQVLKSIAAMRTDHNTRLACFEVVYRRRRPKEVAKLFGINWANLKVYATRVRQRIRGGCEAVQKSNVYAGSEPDVLTICA